MRKMSVVILGLFVAAFFGCASAPSTRPDQRALEARAEATVSHFVTRDPTLRPLLAEAPGYVVFPEIASGGFVVGGEGGVGVVFEDGRPIGYAELQEANIGAQIGGQSYSQIIVFETQGALNRLKAGNFDLSANATATAITAGAAASTRFESGTAVFIDNQSGLMAGATVGGERIVFRAK
jgi:lipid-binding SYLF domain-containing protein